MVCMHVNISGENIYIILFLTAKNVTTTGGVGKVRWDVVWRGEYRLAYEYWAKREWNNRHTRFSCKYWMIALIQLWLSSVQFINVVLYFVSIYCRGKTQPFCIFLINFSSERMTLKSCWENVYKGKKSCHLLTVVKSQF